MAAAAGGVQVQTAPVVVIAWVPKPGPGQEALQERPLTAALCRDGDTQGCLATLNQGMGSADLTQVSESAWV
jgi:hypothetical protein